MICHQIKVNFIYVIVTINLWLNSNEFPSWVQKVEGTILPPLDGPHSWPRNRQEIMACFLQNQWSVNAERRSY